MEYTEIESLILHCYMVSKRHIFATFPGHSQITRPAPATPEVSAERDQAPAAVRDLQMQGGSPRKGYLGSPKHEHISEREDRFGKRK